MFGKPAIELTDAEWLYLLAMSRAVADEENGTSGASRRVTSQRRRPTDQAV
ncbi:MAG: hypothetical protein ACN6N0_06360 [Microvirgula sp.]